jgi:hypothetical protein
VGALLHGEAQIELLARARRAEQLLGALSERAMRRAVVVESLQGLEGPALVALLALWLERSAEGQGSARAVLQELALEPNAFRELPYSLAQAAYSAAREAGLEAVARLFLGEPLQLNPSLDEAFTGNDHCDLAVGVRRAAARGRDRFLLDRLLHDRDHRVIRLLLDNPRIVEQDVVRVAAMRPTRPEVLEVIARHRRWASRYLVRRALIFNPYTPVPIGRGLLPTLMAQDLRMGLEQGLFRAELVELARELIKGRPVASPPPRPGRVELDPEAIDGELTLATEEGL